MAQKTPGNSRNRDIDDSERERQIVGQGGKFSHEEGNVKQIATDEPEEPGSRRGRASGGGNEGDTEGSGSDESGPGQPSSAPAGGKSSAGSKPDR